MANDKCEILLPIHCRHEGVEVGGSLLYLFYRLPIYLQTNLESQRSQVYFAAWLVLLAGYIERILYWLCDCRKPSNFVRNHSRGFNTRLMTRHGQISPFFQKRGRGAVNMASHKSQTVRLFFANTFEDISNLTDAGKSWKNASLVNVAGSTLSLVDELGAGPQWRSLELRTIHQLVRWWGEYNEFAPFPPSIVTQPRLRR